MGRGWQREGRGAGESQSRWEAAVKRDRTSHWVRQFRRTPDVLRDVPGRAGVVSGRASETC